MTARSRVSQADMERTFRALKAAGIERARVVLDLAERKIEVFMGEDDQSGEGKWDWRSEQPLYQDDFKLRRD